MSGLEKLNGDQIVLEEDGTIIDDDDVVKALDKNTLLMVLKENESWKRTEEANVSSCIQINQEGKLDDQNKKSVTKGTTCDGSMRLHICDGKLTLQKPTEEVN